MSQDVYHMSQEEVKRLPVIEAVVSGQMTQLEAAECLDLSTRQVRRLQRRLEEQGPSGLIHQSRGRPSHNRLEESLHPRVIGLIRRKYWDFGPTLACEKLEQFEGIHLSKETLRKWMRSEGMTNGRRRPRPHRQWRERRACLGQMVQMDGSHHRWLEKRGPEFVLMGYVDDATGRVYARFYPSENREAAFDSFGRYCRLYGIPQSIYLDKHTIYKSPGKPTLEDQLANRWPQTQFERALSELGVRVIHANSPQAKGRVERLFRTFQDRLIKEMRLSHIKTPEGANRFLKGFLVRYNRRFSKPARQSANLHRPTPGGKILGQALCIKEPRVVANDGTIQIDSQRLQLLPPGLRPLAKKGVTVTISPKGTMRVLDDGQELRYRVLPVAVRPKPEPSTVELPRAGHGHTPASDHPWRRFKIGRRLKNPRPSKPLNLLEPKGLKA